MPKRPIVCDDVVPVFFSSPTKRATFHAPSRKREPGEFQNLEFVECSKKPRIARLLQHESEIAAPGFDDNDKENLDKDMDVVLEKVAPEETILEDDDEKDSEDESKTEKCKDDNGGYPLYSPISYLVPMDGKTGAAVSSASPASSASASASSATCVVLPRVINEESSCNLVVRDDYDFTAQMRSRIFPVKKNDALAVVVYQAPIAKPVMTTENVQQFLIMHEEQQRNKNCVMEDVKSDVKGENDDDDDDDVDTATPMQID